MGQVGRVSCGVFCLPCLYRCYHPLTPRDLSPHKAFFLSSFFVFVVVVFVVVAFVVDVLFVIDFTVVFDFLVQHHHNHNHHLHHQTKILIKTVQNQGKSEIIKNSTLPPI